jgi:3'(2'), 5'-bisphosphate nucleotidase
MEWDIAAGHALIIASGGDIVDINGETMKYGKPNFKNHQFYAYSSYWIFAGRFL